MESSVLESLLGAEGARNLVVFTALDMVEYVEEHLGIDDESVVFDDAIDSCISESPFVQLIQMSDDDAVSEFGMRLAMELEASARRSDDPGVGSIRKRLAAHFANWLMSTGPEDWEPESDQQAG